MTTTYTTTDRRQEMRSIVLRTELVVKLARKINEGYQYNNHITNKTMSRTKN